MNEWSITCFKSDDTVFKAIENNWPHLPPPSWSLIKLQNKGWTHSHILFSLQCDTQFSFLTLSRKAVHVLWQHHHYNPVGVSLAMQLSTPVHVTFPSQENTVGQILFWCNHLIKPKFPHHRIHAEKHEIGNSSLICLSGNYTRSILITYLIFLWIPS